MKTAFKTVPDTSGLHAPPTLSKFRPHFVAFVCFCSSAAHRNPKIKNAQNCPFSKHFKGFQREIFANEIWLSPTQSRPVQPNPTNPLGYEPLSD
jgi:hypothetical protein